jgi:hypothetical protein
MNTTDLIEYCFTEPSFQEQMLKTFCNVSEFAVSHVCYDNVNVFEILTNSFICFFIFIISLKWIFDIYSKRHSQIEEKPTIRVTEPC